MFNGQSDTLVLQAEGIDTYIVCPSVVYGGASAGVKTMGVGYSLLTGYAKPFGYVPYIGNGTAILSTVCRSHPRPYPLILIYADPRPGLG